MEKGFALFGFFLLCLIALLLELVEAQHSVLEAWVSLSPRAGDPLPSTAKVLHSIEKCVSVVFVSKEARWEEDEAERVLRLDERERNTRKLLQNQDHVVLAECRRGVCVCFVLVAAREPVQTPGFEGCKYADQEHQILKQSAVGEQHGGASFSHREENSRELNQAQSVVLSKVAEFVRENGSSHFDRRFLGNLQKLTGNKENLSFSHGSSVLVALSAPLVNVDAG